MKDRKKFAAGFTAGVVCVLVVVGLVAVGWHFLQPVQRGIPRPTVSLSWRL